MKRYIVSANKSRSNPYLDINSKFKENQFDKDKFFETIENIFYENNVHTDDLKANVYVSEYPEDNEIDVKCTLSWIFYPEDISKKDFAKEAKRIEKIFESIYGKAFWFECDVNRYDDSEYSSNGYDVEMKLRTQFKLESGKEY